jgi:hypothetical protein
LALTNLNVGAKTPPNILIIIEFQWLEFVMHLIHEHWQSVDILSLMIFCTIGGVLQPIEHGWYKFDLLKGNIFDAKTK